MKERLDALALHYHTPAFITEDPMQFAASFRHDLPRCEANALLAALLSYGRRETIIAKLGELFERLEEPVYDVLQRESLEAVEKRLKGFVYRFNTGQDVALLLRWWHAFYQQHPTHHAWLSQYLTHTPLSDSSELQDYVIRPWLNAWLPPDFLTSGSYRYGTRYMVPHPATGGACKRIHMALRWLCRDDSSLGENAVDFGLWSDIIPPQHLWMPMDTHVGRISRDWKLLTRKSTDAKAALALTQTLATFRPHDPTYYDFALLGLGVDTVRHRTPLSL